jgi:hypothetical protein
VLAQLGIVWCNVRCFRTGQGMAFGEGATKKGPRNNSHACQPHYNLTTSPRLPDPSSSPAPDTTHCYCYSFDATATTPLRHCNLHVLALSAPHLRTAASASVAPSSRNSRPLHATLIAPLLANAHESPLSCISPATRTRSALTPSLRKPTRHGLRRVVLGGRSTTQKLTTTGAPEERMGMS